MQNIVFLITRVLRICIFLSLPYNQLANLPCVLCDAYEET